MKHQPLNICPFVMCNLIQACHAGAFDGWRHAWRLDEREKVEKEGERSSWLSEFWVWQQHRTVAVRRRVCTIQRSIHFLYIHQSSHHLYPFIPRGPSWLECLHSSEWEKAKVSFLYIYFAKLILLAFPPRRVRHRHNIRDPPSMGWQSLNLPDEKWYAYFVCWRSQKCLSSSIEQFRGQYCGE